MVKNLPAMWETWVQSLDQEDPLEKGMATHSLENSMDRGVCWPIVMPSMTGRGTWEKGKNQKSLYGRKWHLSWALNNGSDSDRQRGHTQQQSEELIPVFHFEKDFFTPWGWKPTASSWESEACHLLAAVSSGTRLALCCIPSIEMPSCARILRLFEQLPQVAQPLRSQRSGPGQEAAASLGVRPVLPLLCPLQSWQIAPALQASVSLSVKWG